MSETPRPTADKQEAYQAFIEHYNLNPSNNDAIMNCLFEQAEEIQTLKNEFYWARMETKDWIQYFYPNNDIVVGVNDQEFR